ncbi:MAG TPA: amidohydrolase family protein, partial [Novosphingobium sp.]|nr:amidohydrolase family protein [Novosphingobium sp.]
MPPITLFSARAILTMDRNCPRATHVAVREGKVLGVGTAESLAGWGPALLDTRFADKVLLPGFVEGHAHAMTGHLWKDTYLGHMERIDPAGRRWAGLGETEAVVARLSAATAARAGVLMGWGFDPLFVAGERLSRQHLDRVSATRPVIVLHSNGHLMTVNSAALALAAYDRTTCVPGVCKDAAGEPTGELHEMAAMGPVFMRLGLAGLQSGEPTYRAFAELARRAGVTTATDLGATIAAADVPALRAFIDRPDFPLRLAVMLMAHHRPPAEILAEALALAPLGSDKLRLGAVKIVLDGSIQGFTAQLRWPGYYRGTDHGLWNIAPEQLFELVAMLNAAGVQIHIHTNGDLATDLALEAFAAALARTPRFDHRHTLQHCQMADAAQFRRMKALGLACNLFAN